MEVGYSLMNESIDLETSFIANKESPRNVTSCNDDMMDELTSSAELEKDIDFSKRKGKEKYLSLSEAFLHYHLVQSSQLMWNFITIFLIIFNIVIFLLIVLIIYMA